ncbi:MAG: redoxin domain-containing protein [Actinobacteria bacterium]|nr:redoxin domain-containing protein [Actinomycetota bacterium]MBI3686121.1 redoxin domain-containing protein [Actinomycetota bacterium]
MARKTSSRPGRAARPTGRRAAEAAREKARRQWRTVAVVGAGLGVFAVVVALSRAPASTAPAAASTAPAAQGYRADRTAFDLPALTGDGHVRLADHRGRPVVVNFFASWCVYCNEELPGFVQVARATHGGVDFVGVQTSDTGDGVAMARRFDLAGAGFSLARDIGAAPGSDLWSSFGSDGLPVTAFYDRNGALVDFSGGMLTQQALEDRLRKNYGVDVRAAEAANLVQPVIPLIPPGAAELIRTNAGNPSFVVLDARPPADFAAGHIPDAVDVDATAADFRQRLGALDHTASYVVYSGTADASAAATATMHDLGFRHVYDITSGIAGWRQAGLPVTR